MRDLSADEMLADDIVTLLDAALADPSRAPRVRAAMRARLAASEAVVEADDEADADDLWENVPL
jgi:hypothetical protein